MPSSFHFDPIYRLLALAARIKPGDKDSKILAEAMLGFTDWHNLVSEAENNAIAPLLYTSLRAAGVQMPQDVKRQLYALVQRHRWANHSRALEMSEIVQRCKLKSLRLILLKGSYLAHSIYPDPSLRTMSDIDILSAPDQAIEVQKTLTELGYTTTEQASSKYMSEHHHLPGAHKTRDGISILIEVHHDALSGDAPASITTNNLTGPLIKFCAENTEHFALGHIDQLRHLYHHMSEPASKLKIIWCVDIVYYASHFENEIDWRLLEQHYPKVINALRLVDFIIPLPENLRHHVKKNSRPMPHGTGISILPLTAIKRQPFKESIELILYPSNWWLRLYYGIPPDEGLFFTRWLRHPWQVLLWYRRRIRASHH